MKTAFIYGLRCPLTGLIRYVGKCDDPKTRLPGHLKDPKKNHRTNWIKSLTKQGLKPALEIIAEVPWGAWQFWERSYIRLYRCIGFDLVNATDGGDGSLNPGLDTRAKLRAARLGRKMPPEFGAAISARKRGKKLSPEHCEKLSIAHTGLAWSGARRAAKVSTETRAKMSASRLGKKLSPETCAKMSVSQMGRKVSAETRAKISAAHLGKKYSQERCAQISATLTGKKASEETRARMSRAQKARYENGNHI